MKKKKKVKKNKKVVKKVSKKKAKKARKPSMKSVHHKVTVEVKSVPPEKALVPVTEKDLLPEKEAGKFMLVPSALSEKQVMKMLQRTPPAHIHKRPAKGGGEWEYVTGTYMKKVLNFVFGWMWSFDIISIEEKHGQVIVRGKLTIHKKDGSVLLWKSDVGNADLKYKKDKPHTSENLLDYGNDEKAAITDCIKRCAAQFGFASDVYGKSEFKDIGVEVKDSDAPKQSPMKVEARDVVKDEHSQEQFDCHGIHKGGCGYGETLTKAEYDYSMKVFKKPLGRKCQAELKGKK